MKKALIVAAALGLLSAPALAQQTPGGQSAGGPARVGIPGEMTPQARPMKRMKKQRMMKQKKMHRRMKHNM